MLYLIREGVDRYQQCWITRLLMLVMATMERKANESFDNGFFFDIEAKRDSKEMLRSQTFPLL